MHMTNSNLQIAGIILCGGISSRMGQSKALLPFGNESMLQRVIRIMSQVTSPIVAVKADNQRSIICKNFRKQAHHEHDAEK